VPTPPLSLVVEQHQWLAQKAVGPITQKTAIKATAIRRGQPLPPSVDPSCRPSPMRLCEPKHTRSVSKINPLLHDRRCSTVHLHLGRSRLLLYRVVHSIITRRRTFPKAIRRLCPSLPSSYHLLLPTKTDHLLCYYLDSNWGHSFNHPKRYRR
jgi:hypothetical protein